MEKHLANKVVIVTGAAAGIGRATALSCAHEGAKVIVADMMRNEGDEVVEQIKKEEEKHPLSSPMFRTMITLRTL